MEFAKRFGDACKRSGLDTQVQIGKALGVSQAMAGYYLTGEKMPGMGNAISFAKRLKVNVEWLLSGNGAMDSSTSLSPDEQNLLDDYRSSNQTGKEALRSTARAFATTDSKTKAGNDK